MGVVLRYGVAAGIGFFAGSSLELKDVVKWAVIGGAVFVGAKALKVI